MRFANQIHYSIVCAWIVYTRTWRAWNVSIDRIGAVRGNPLSHPVTFVRYGCRLWTAWNRTIAPCFLSTCMDFLPQWNCYLCMAIFTRSFCSATMFRNFRVAGEQKTGSDHVLYVYQLLGWPSRDYRLQRTSHVPWAWFICATRTSVNTIDMADVIVLAAAPIHKQVCQSQSGLTSTNNWLLRISMALFSLKIGFQAYVTTNPTR